MPKTSGDELFEKYLSAHGYDPGPHEPDLSGLGIFTRPDFLPSRGNDRIACEVEQFKQGASKLERRLSMAGHTSASGQEVYLPVRRRVAKAAQQLRPLRGLGIPLVVVLTNPDGALVQLEVSRVIAALYGDEQFVMPMDLHTGQAAGAGFLEYGRNGKLTNDHSYISAVAVLRSTSLRAERISQIAAERPSKAADFDTAVDEALDLFERIDEETLPEGERLHVDVIETVSENAKPLPDDWFNGPDDTRWAVTPTGNYERRR